MSGYPTQEELLNINNKRAQNDMNFDGAGDESIGKKPKLQDPSTPAVPSKTLHVRNLPPDAGEQDLIAIACPFGRVTNVLLLKGKNQALIQMDDVQCTAALVHYYSSVRANIRGKPIYFQYSTRDEITAGQQGPEQQNHVLLVTVLNVLFPVDIDVLHRVFTKYGTIQKVVIFNKTAGLQALVQFSDVNSAVAAKMELDGQNIYSGCCTLRIQYSSLQDLNVKYNSDKSRDFTNPSLPTSTNPGALGGDAAGLYPGNGAGWINNPASISPYSAYPYGVAAPLGAGKPANPLVGGMMGGLGSAGMGSAVLIVSGLDPERVSPDNIFMLFGVYGDVLRVKILHNKRDTALVQFVNPQQAETALTHLNGCPLLGRPLKVNFSKHATISLPRTGEEGAHLTKDFSGTSLHRYKVVGSRNFQHICPPSPVLHVSNIPESASEEMVRELFSQFGTVVGFRFFPKDKRMGLVQMGSVGEAADALVNLHNYTFGGSNLRISFSKANM